jgi:hypothetical protein
MFADAGTHADAAECAPNDDQRAEEREQQNWLVERAQAIADGGTDGQEFYRDALLELSGLIERDEPPFGWLACFLPGAIPHRPLYTVPGFPDEPWPEMSEFPAFPDRDAEPDPTPDWALAVQWDLRHHGVLRSAARDVPLPSPRQVADAMARVSGEPDKAGNAAMVHGTDDGRVDYRAALAELADVRARVLPPHGWLAQLPNDLLTPFDLPPQIPRGGARFRGDDAWGVELYLSLRDGHPGSSPGPRLAQLTATTTFVCEPRFNALCSSINRRNAEKAAVTPRLPATAKHKRTIAGWRPIADIGFAIAFCRYQPSEGLRRAEPRSDFVPWPSRSDEAGRDVVAVFELDRHHQLGGGGQRGVELGDDQIGFHGCQLERALLGAGKADDAARGLGRT